MTLKLGKVPVKVGLHSTSGAPAGTCCRNDTDPGDCPDPILLDGHCTAGGCGDFANVALHWIPAQTNPCGGANGGYQGGTTVHGSEAAQFFAWCSPAGLWMMAGAVFVGGFPPCGGPTPDAGLQFQDGAGGPPLPVTFTGYRWTACIPCTYTLTLHT